MGLTNKGQVTVEYILLIGMIVAIIFSTFRLLREKVLADAGNCTRTSTSLICQLEGVWTGQLRGRGGTCSFPFRCYSIR